MKKIKNIIRLWTLDRLLRLALGLIFLFNAIAEQLWVLLIISGIFLYQAFTASGCGTACQSAMFYKKANDPKEKSLDHK